MRSIIAYALIGVLGIGAHASDIYEGEALECYSEELLRKAEDGDAKAQYNLGLCYDGMGVDRNSEEAFKWFKLSAENGNSYGQFNLGGCYDKGIGTGKNYREAVRWYKRSADQGNPWGMLCLATSYNNGTGVDMDFVESLKWEEKAAEKGISEYTRSTDYQRMMIRQQEEEEQSPNKKTYTKTDDYLFVDASDSDGDTISMRDTEGRIIECRLRGVDAFEIDNVIAEQVDDQARYFGLSSEQAIELGKQAKAFTQKVLKGIDGKQRFSFVSMPFRFNTDTYKRVGGKDGPIDPDYKFSLDGDIVVENESLACLLVKNGLARIHGTIPVDPSFSFNRIKIERLEAEAKSAGVGGWGMAKQKKSN